MYPTFIYIGTVKYINLLIIILDVDIFMFYNSLEYCSYINNNSQIKVFYYSLCIIISTKTLKNIYTPTHCRLIIQQISYIKLPNKYLTGWQVPHAHFANCKQNKCKYFLIS